MTLTAVTLPISSSCPAVEALYTALEQSHGAEELLDARLAYNDFKGAVNLIQNDSTR